MPELQQVLATRYLTPLREGGSLPGLVEADDLGIYVCKFRGAGQGLPVLVAEVIAAGIARALGLRTPQQVVVELTDPIARYEADEEVQDLLRASLGHNLGVDFLPGAFGVDDVQGIDPAEAGRVLWMDGFIANVDRSWRNPNLLRWHGDLWVIDHGASLYFHHGWRDAVGDPARFAVQPWSAEDHILGEFAEAALAVDAEAGGLLTDAVLTEIVAAVPSDWLVGPVPAEELRSAYVAFLAARRDGVRPWLGGGRG